MLGLEGFGDNACHIKLFQRGLFVTPSLGGEENHRNALVFAAELMERRNAVLPWHHHIEQNRIKRLRSRQFYPFGSGRRRRHLPMGSGLQGNLGDLANTAIIINDKNVFRHGIGLFLFGHWSVRSLVCSVIGLCGHWSV